MDGETLLQLAMSPYTINGLLRSALRDCNGLVNKAKARLLENGPATPPKSQSAVHMETPEKPHIKAVQPEVPRQEAKALPRAEVKAEKVEAHKDLGLFWAGSKRIGQVRDGCCPNCA